MTSRPVTKSFDVLMHVSTIGCPQSSSLRRHPYEQSTGGSYVLIHVVWQASLSFSAKPIQSKPTHPSQPNPSNPTHPIQSNPTLQSNPTHQIQSDSSNPLW